MAKDITLKLQYCRPVCQRRRRLSVAALVTPSPTTSAIIRMPVSAAAIFNFKTSRIGGT
jgi:hypothetical protein